MKKIILSKKKTKKVVVKNRKPKLSKLNSINNNIDNELDIEDNQTIKSAETFSDDEVDEIQPIELVFTRRCIMGIVFLVALYVIGVILDWASIPGAFTIQMIALALAIFIFGLFQFDKMSFIRDRIIRRMEEKRSRGD